MIETERLHLRRLALDDAGFVLGLLNQPSWLRFIGDKNVHTLDDARRYLEQGPMASYQRNGFGLYLTALKTKATPLGICGLIKRDSLQDVDIGFAFLPEFCGQGYAFEAAAAVLHYGRHTLGLRRIVAITSPDNQHSIRLLQKLGLKFE
ncbi:MAG: Protein N-acetyltransferase, RimJ/RimL family [Nevskia sp.]|nr:Protein N-acetyltransferase, RimJ/RimL family [Nevskia sp.]